MSIVLNFFLIWFILSIPASGVVLFLMALGHKPQEIHGVESHDLYLLQ